MVTALLVSVAVLVGGNTAHHTFAQQDRRPDETLQAIQLQPNVFMLAGAGSNIVVQIGPDGVVLVDAGSARMADAVIAAVKKAGSTDTEKLIAAMEGLEFDTPKGKMTFRKEDHQALQVMYQWRMKANPPDNTDLLELVREIPADEMKLPIKNKR